MSVRKRTWRTPSGAARESWVVDYVDQAGKRRLRTFTKKRDADQFSATARVQIREGTHVADSASVTVRVAGELWISTATGAGRESSTTAQYRQHLTFHIGPLIGSVALSKLSAPAVRAFEDALRSGGRSSAMVRKVMTSLSSLLADAQERGLVARNVVRDLRGRRTAGTERKAERRQRGKLKVGVDIPTRQEIKAIAERLEGRWRPLLLAAIFTGLRASELRGLRWTDIDLDERLLHVRQRADRYNAIGSPKSEAGERAVPMPPLVVNALKEWKLICPRGELNLVFPNGKGKVESLANILQRGFMPAQVKAGVSVPKVAPSGKPLVDQAGKEVPAAKYTGLHTLRHFYASWCINRRADGGLELPAKIVQERLGHATIGLTLDTYSHLFPRSDDGAELAAAERALLA